MQSSRQLKARALATDNPKAELKEIVMGLHWDPPAHTSGAEPVDLDALCVLLDDEQRVVDVIHPGHPRSAEGGVVHTGDSRNGASTWEDERIFAFLEALPPAVTTLAFAVVSVNGRPFDAVAGAACHVSDRLSEYQWLRTDLTALSGLTTHVAAILGRGRSGWSMLQRAQSIEAVVHEHAQRVAGSGKYESDTPDAQARGE